MSWDWLASLAIGVVFLWVSGVVSKWVVARVELPERESIGAVKGLEVGITSDELRDFVGLTCQAENLYVRALMSPQQARVLAEWLRIAASKGKTVTLARMNHRRAMAASPAQRIG